MSAMLIEVKDEPVRLDVLVEAVVAHIGLSQAEAEAEVRRVCGDMHIALTEVGHA